MSGNTNEIESIQNMCKMHLWLYVCMSVCMNTCKDIKRNHNRKFFLAPNEEGKKKKKKKINIYIYIYIYPRVIQTYS